MKIKKKSNSHVKRLVAETHKMPKYAKLYVSEWASDFLKENPNVNTRYSLTNFKFWKSYRSDIFVHKSGVLLLIGVRKGLRLSLGGVHPQGYFQLDDKTLVHRVVATVWKENKYPKTKPIVNHEDGDKRNNCADNLKWCSNSYNILHARSSGLNPYNKPTSGLKIGGQRKGTSKFFGVFFDKARSKWIGQVRHNNVVYGRRRFDTEEDAAIHYNNVCDLLGIADKPRNDFRKRKIRVTKEGKKTIRSIGTGIHLFSISE
jgi:hypothetical protein